MTTAHVTCPLCEATCGLEVTLDENQQVNRVRGDRADVFSRGYICPKGASLGALHHDPDRLKTPLVKRDGEFVEVGWDEAFAEIEARLPPIMAEHGSDAVAVYAGNPTVHNVALLLYGRVLFKALGTKNFFTATSVDQLPKHYSSGYLFGDPQAIPVPDLDRTRHLLILGANPLVSNGSLMTAADVRGRLRGIQRRGGKIVVLDPRRTRTAAAADEHHPIRPGTDALLLFALVNVLFAENRVKLGRLAEYVNGIGEIRELAAPFTPGSVAAATGIEAAEIRRIALELADAESAAVYGRIGTTTQTFGTIASWLVDVVNVLTGNLDSPGGVMFPLAAAGRPVGAGKRRAFTTGRWASRVRGYPEVLGELPVATLADEIETPGKGQVRALISISGNPSLSTPNGARLTEALRQLDFMVSVDVYLNETSREADVILAGPSPLERPHYDVALYQLAVRNVANWTPATLPTDLPQEWETMLRLTGIVAGQGPDADVAALDGFVAAELAKRSGVELPEGRTGPERLVDIMLRGGPYDLTLADLEAAPHGVDLGALRPRIPEVLGTADGRIELAPPSITTDIGRLRAELAKAPDDRLLLIGRRHLSSNNSWMHNLEPLVRGGNRCTVQVHPADATRLGLSEGGLASVTSRTGKLQVPVEITDEIRPGVVSIPHGWGHDVDGVRTLVASAHGGVNSNLVTDETLLDVPSGTSVLNGIPVEVTPG
ncbi:molybdopterin-dependent oxidoreductase [Amycolatopsis sp. H20-H5]|uniref:molybdopterin-dependent oxidoreductase n=1 Tax=Amycolatopsis sp. H20-H5 TaxID=3046309 RepID=UPI002DBE5485|nr:molybdopterin-dependent oxidoreductase [Amycolatopsis sp. H20-H5]MEC3975649.1 molybdopterin-dependent oxidoreductase [Amycolatopsis sp. H20-H5]